MSSLEQVHGTNVGTNQNFKSLNFFVLRKAIVGYHCILDRIFDVNFDITYDGDQKPSICA